MTETSEPKTATATHPMTMSRRAALLGAASLPLAAAFKPSVASAAAEMMGTSIAPYTRFKLGDFEVTTLLAGTNTVPDPHNIFGLNASDEEFAAASKAAMIPTDVAQFFFTPTLVNTGSELVLFDTGTHPAGIVNALEAAGYGTEQVDKVVLTHMHGDHIGGLMGEGGETFANASYVAGQVEFDHWAKAGDDMFEAKVRPLAEKMTFIGEGGAPASGITGMEAFGHTPGHMAFMLDSGGQQMLLGADFANHYVWSLAYPDWEVHFDMDKSAAAATRRRVLDMLATTGTPFVGYHMPFPATGYVETRNDGFHYVPSSYQLLMDR